MDESNAIRAITIGVSTFIAIMTISAVMMYYNTARDTVNAIGTGTDIAQNYSDYIRDLLLKPGGSITGADVKNILNYYYMDERVGVIIEDQITKKGYVSTGNPHLDGTGKIVLPHAISTNGISGVNQSSETYNRCYLNIISEKFFRITDIKYYDSEQREVKEITIREN